MAESRRIQLTTLSCSVALPSSSSRPTSAPKPTPGVQQESETRPDFDKVHRLELTLFEPDERCFPEFSYSQLLENKINCSKDEISLNKFVDGEQREDDEVAAIARKLEEKYGSKPKKKKDRIQDLIDIGYGYDDEDTFIDNSEAYDEFVPASITTKFGGFYINSGVLQFRQVSDTEDLTQDENTPELSKKRKLNGGKEKPKKKSFRDDGEMKKEVDLESSTPSRVRPDNAMKKKKKAAGMLSVTSMLKKFQREKEKERQKANQRAAAIAGVPTIPLCPADAGGGGGSGLTEPLLSLIGSTNDHELIQAASTVDFDIDLDSLLEDSEKLSSKAATQPAVEAPLFQPKTDGHARCDAAHTKTSLQLKPEQTSLLPQTGATSAQCVPMPEGLPVGLPVGLEGSIQKLMVAAKTLEGESKLKFFTPEINSILLDIELQCREQGGQLRSKVYSHLTSFLPCSRDTILKRVKKLLAAHMEELPNVEDPVHILKEAIGKVMPEQITQFHEICQVYEQMKASRAKEDETEGSQKMNVASEETVEEKGVKKAGPKKLFKWNEEIKECLGNVLKVKMEGHEKERKGSQEMEEYLKTLLDNEVKPLWPKGWMQSRVLIRESRKILGTSLPVKRVRSEKKQQPPSVCGPPEMSGGCSIVQGSPLQSTEADDVFIVNPSISTALSKEGLKREAAAVMKLEENTGVGGTVDYVSSNAAKSDRPVVITPSASTPSLLDLLADQALAQEQPMSVSHELLAAAVAKYQQSVQHWSFGFDTKSPPFPPPPPQTSPVGFSVSGACQVLVPQMLQNGDFARNMNARQAVSISDDPDTAI